MIDFEPFFDELQSTELAPWCDPLRSRLETKLAEINHGDLPRWLNTLSQLPDLQPNTLELDRGSLLIGTGNECDVSERGRLEEGLRALMPWRKGPYELFGINLDTEWRSDLKWDRLIPHLSPLKHRTVLDVGCGNGYHCWRLHAAGAKRVIGIDPSWKFLIQFRSLKKYIGQLPVELLPLGVEEMPVKMRAFDTVLSMGVFYHRRSPIDHLLELMDLLRPGGELVLETLVIEGGPNDVLLPSDRYAQMRNVWFLPSCEALQSWMERAGYRNVRCVDINQTGSEEQRQTSWMQFHSLPQFLDPNNPDLTVEGLPAPRRAIMMAEAPR